MTTLMLSYELEDQESLMNGKSIASLILFAGTTSQYWNLGSGTSKKKFTTNGFPTSKRDWTPIHRFTIIALLSPQDDEGCRSGPRRKRTENAVACGQEGTHQLGKPTHDNGQQECNSIFINTINNLIAGMPVEFISRQQCLKLKKTNSINQLSTLLYKIEKKTNEKEFCIICHEKYLEEPRLLTL
ncbi:hypothetical protein HHI36_004416 [Cryptolaemus montrouzieri]|uniref:Uncharacterized protein n=1 Tax=Cryptolaemus montrouzieri TaxID=559131 RepID=A0ABD2NRE5_9CUCU